jgi:tryptophan synthase alpha chain
LPPEEEKELKRLISDHKMNLVYLLAPTSSLKRKRIVVKASRGFVYYVSLTGVTGVRSSVASGAGKNITAIKKLTKLPVCAGFGVSDPAQAKEIAKSADGVIIGSALVRSLEAHPRLSAAAFAKKFVKPFARAVHA